MRDIRKIIKEIIYEILDNPKTPENTEIINGADFTVFRFKTIKNEYCVSFKEYKNFEPLGLTKDKKTNDIITTSKSVYFLSWGICDNNNISNPIDDVETDSKEEIYVFNSVFGIIKDFMLKNNPNIIFYQALSKRKSIYNNIINKFGLNYIIIHGPMNTFLINKELL